MITDRPGGLCLVVGSVGALVTMGLHPVGGAAERVADMAAVAVGVHALGIASVWLQTIGFLRLSRVLGRDRFLPQAAFTAYAFAAGAVVIAASVSGFLSPAIAKKAIAPDAVAADTWRTLMRHAYEINQAFDWVWVFGTAVAIALWSVFMLGTRGVWKTLGVAGIVLALATVAAFGGGWITTDVHGAMIFVIGLVAWTVGAGVLMLRSP